MTEETFPTNMNRVKVGLQMSATDMNFLLVVIGCLAAFRHDTRHRDLAELLAMVIR